MSTEASWLTILDYAVKNGVSLSTIRRYIKSNKVTYKKEHGKYLLLDEPQDAALSQATQRMNQRHSIDTRIEVLERRFNDAQEQINELKMLVAIYEEKLQGL